MEVWNDMSSELWRWQNLMYLSFHDSPEVDDNAPHNVDLRHGVSTVLVLLGSKAVFLCII